MDNQPVQDLALNEDNIFQADECDAFDSDVDDEPTAQSIFLAYLSSVGWKSDKTRIINLKLYNTSMCIDFKNINAACLKDYYPLPEINSKIESVMGFPFKCLLDAYKGYHQVQMAEEDEEKIAFYTDQGTYCYTKMPFGLKNAGATYQRLVDEAF
ncbi:hypothetical protein Tco_0349531 [Tanacetum coccineum]